MVHSQNSTTLGTAGLDTAKAGVLQGIDLATASFSRHGTNLVVATADGRSTTVEGWFGHSASATLDLGDGRSLPYGLVNSLAVAGSPAQYAQAGQAAPLQVIGRIDKVTGKVELVHRDGRHEPASAGAQVYLGDVVTTAGDGAIGISFADASTFSLGKSGRMVLDELVYDPEAHTGSSSMTVVAGAFTLVSGAIAKTAPGAAQVKTPVMTIGIRGTSTAGFIDATGEKSLLTLLLDPDGSVGELLITNAGGSVVLNQSGLTVRVPSFNAPPQNPTRVSSAELNSLFSDALNAQPQHLSPPPPTAEEHGNHDNGQAVPDTVKPPPATTAPPVTTEQPQPTKTAPIEQPQPPVQDKGSHQDTGNTDRHSDADQPKTNSASEPNTPAPENHAPVIGGNTSASGHGTATGTLTFTDSDDDTTSFSAGTPTHGTLTWSGGRYSYTRTGNWGNGDTDSFAVSVSDGKGGTASTTVTLTMTDSGKSIGRADTEMVGLTFDGSNDSINLSTSGNGGAQAFQGSDDFSIAMWVRPDAAGGVMYRQHPGGGQLGIYTSVTNNGNILFGMDNGGWVWAASGAGTVTAGEWVQLTFVKSDHTLTIYMNGSAIGTATIGAAQFNATAGTGDIVFGRDYTGSYFDGALGQLAVFSTALSAGDVQAWSKGPQSSAYLEELYLMDSSNGTTFADTSGNNHDFTIGTATTPTFQLIGSITATDPDGDTLIGLSASNPSNGTLTFTADGSYGSGEFVYTPSPLGADSFTVTSSDSHGASTTVTLPTRVTSGDDTFVSSSANELIEGGPGSDKVTFSGTSDDYSYAVVGDRLVVTDMTGGDGRDTLSNVEVLDFTDMDRSVAWNAGTPTITLNSGGGAYTFTVNSALVAGGSAINGGAGVDTIKIFGSASLTDGAFVDVTGVETLKLSGGGSVALGNYSASAGISSVDASTSSAGVTIDTSGRVGGITVTGSSHSDDFVLAQHELTTILGFDNHDHLDLSNALFGLGTSGTLDASHFSNAGTAPAASAQNLGASGAGIMVVVGTGGADVYAVDDLSAVTSGNSYQIAHLDNVTAHSVDATDFKLVS